MSDRTDSSIQRPESRQQVYKYISQHGPVTRQNLFAGSGLSLPTIKQSIEFLLSNELIVASDIVRNTGGRNAIAYNVLDTGRSAIGIYLSSNHLTGVVVDLNGVVQKTLRYRIPFNVQNEDYLKKIGEMAINLKDSCDIQAEKLLGVGIAIPSFIDADGETIIHGLTHDFTNVSRSVLSRYIPYHTILLHDSEAAGFAEIWKNTEINNAVYLNLNNSIGGCVVINHKVYSGDSLLAGEVGHMIIEPRSKVKCYCGRYGCFDTVCNAGILDSYTDGNLEKFFEMLKAGDKKATQIWEQYLYYLAICIHNIHMLLNCKIIIGGYVGAYIGSYINELTKLVEEHNVFHEYASDYVIPCKHKIEATAAGAAIRLIEDLIVSL